MIRGVIMNFKKLLLAILVLIFILNIGAVCASDNATDEMISSDATDEILSDQGIGDDLLNTLDDGKNDTLTQSEDSSIMESTENTESVTDYGSLVNAVNHAKTSNGTNYTINLEDGTYECTSGISWGGASSVKTLIINGNNQTVDGKQKASFITIENGYTLILNDITISNFKQTSAGGAISAKTTSTLNTNNVIFRDNNGRNGVAIWIQNGNAHIFNTTFIHNTASATGASVWAGLGNIIIEECNFIENTATGTAGGAVYVGSTNARIVNSNFTNNKNTKGSGAAIYNDMKLLNVENCIFTNNSAKKGGAVYSDSSINVEKSAFVENEASAEGGAIYVYGSATANIIENTFMNDKSPAGAEISSNKGLLEDNTIMNSAGVEAIKGTITQENNKIYEAENVELVWDYGSLVSAVNHAKTSNGTNYTINLQDGIYECTSGISWGGASSVKTLIINGNNQTVDGKQKASFITIENGYTLILNDITISNFKQTSAGGAISAKTTSTLNTNNVIFRDNNGRNGVAIWIQNGNAHIFNTTFIHNTASATGASVWAGLGNIIIEECNFIENTATGTAGGAVYVGSTNARIVNSNFTNNKNTKGSGAAIYNDMKLLNVENCIFTNNSAKKGGAVYSDSSINVEKSAFVENEASAEGGAIYVYGSATANIIENTFMNDKSPAGAEISSNKGLLENNTIINSAGDGAIKGTITQENNKIYDSEMLYLLDQITDPVLKKYLELQYQEMNNIKNELNSTLSELDDANVKIGELNSTLNQTLVDLDDANNKISNLTEQMANATTQLADVIAQLGEVQKEIQNLSGDLISTKITAKALTVQALNKGVLEITLTDGNDTVLANKTIYVYVNGVTKQLTTNVNGTAKLSVKFSKAGTYAPLITYMGDKTYSASMAAGKITVAKKATSIIAPKATFKVNQKTKKVKITLKSGKKVVAGKKVTIYVNGKTFYAKTNSKGVAVITVKLTKTGSFKYIAKFAGDGAYKATSKKGYIAIKK